MTLDTEGFLEKLIKNNYTHLCIVPCSFAKSLINAVINDKRIEYLPCASEAVACSVASGLKIAGKNPIVLVQSSGLTNMGSCLTSLNNPYEIVFPIIVSWRRYRANDSEIQHKHLSEGLIDLIKAYGYDFCILDKNNINSAVEQINISNSSRTICILEKETFSNVELKDINKIDLTKYDRRSKYLQELNNLFLSEKVLFIGTTGNTAREMYAFMPDTNNFYMVGNMGGALSIGLGVSLGGNQVVVCGGDAEFVMHMGGLTTVGRYASQANLIYILFDNESNKSTGGQRTYQEHLNYINIAKSCGFLVNNDVVKNIEDFKQAINSCKSKKGLKFLWVKCSYDEDAHRPPIEKVKVSKILWREDD